MRLHYSALSQLGLFGKKTENNWKHKLLCAITDGKTQFAKTDQLEFPSLQL